MSASPDFVRYRWLREVITIGLAGLLTACTVGPRYQRAQAPSAPEWKTQPPWQTAAPKDGIPKGAWWTIYHEDQLNELEQQLLKANQSLAAASSRLQEARAFARVQTAAYFPQTSVDPNANRARYSANRAVLGAAPPTSAITQSIYNIPFSLSYEVDLFGRVRRNLEAANANLQASAADLGNVQLVLTAELAADYFSLRELDSETDVLRQAEESQAKAMRLIQNRHDQGVSSGLDVAQQAAVLDATRTQLNLIQQQRAEFEHAIATLTGNPAPSFTMSVTPLRAVVPPVPLGVPSDLLQRRPDVATAERHMAYENAEVGLATTAFYPHITLFGSGGFQSTSLTSLISAPSAVWSFGGDILQPLFQGGRNRANLQLAKSTYDESVANYRETVLESFQQVEDSLAGLNALAKAQQTQQAAVEDSQRALNLANNRYTGGIATYLDVVTAQTTLLNNERLATQLLGQQMVTSVQLVKALGGSWDASLIQNEQVHPEAKQVFQQ
ncbi:MAG TPA: efflux transporter outer membrane subunit [Terriglobales bacterium]|nr:efflux transporter outer membrane subunit [Terriglobales bacterium]